MSKIIVALEQLDEGAINPGTGMYEQPIWKITLKGQEERLLGKHKMEEYISKAYGKAIHRFKRWKVMTKTSETHVYVVAKNTTIAPVQELSVKLVDVNMRRVNNVHENIFFLIW